MRYLGGLRGTGILKCGSDTASASAAYDIDGFLRGNNQVAACGEIHPSPGALRNVFGRRDLQLLTDDGRVLRLSFCGPRPRGRHDALRAKLRRSLWEQLRATRSSPVPR